MAEQEKAAAGAAEAEAIDLGLGFGVGLSLGLGLRFCLRGVCLGFRLRLGRLLGRRRFGGIFLGRRFLFAPAFAFAFEQRNNGADLHTLFAFGDKDAADLALVNRFEFHRRLVGFDLGDDVAGLHLIAFFYEPAGKLAFLHRRGKRRHLQFNRHQ